MDSFDLKVEKAKAILRYRRLRKIASLFRCMEICIFLIVISRFTTQLPINFKLSGEYFRGLSVSLVSPWFVFVLGNSIIVVLFFKSGQFSTQEDSISNSRIDLYEEYVENCEKTRIVSHGDEKKKLRKQSMCQESRGVSNRKIQRSHSENLERENYEVGRGKLRRSATETCRVSEKSPVNSCAEDDMSSEEFRRKVEAFIARQQRSLREEEISAVVSFGP